MKVWMAGMAALVIAGAGLGYLAIRPVNTDLPAGSETVPGGPLVEIDLPDTLSGKAQLGKVAFDNNCAACHGTDAVGRDGAAPPLVHRFYEPSHHGDEAFQRAVSLGVKSHHWRFGDMAPVAGLTRGDVAMIVAYIRELQRANGIN